jgi:hypothetical protein
MLAFANEIPGVAPRHGPPLLEKFVLRELVAASPSQLQAVVPAVAARKIDAFLGDPYRL